MTSEPVRAGADWLALREPADAAARSSELVEDLRHLVASADSTEIHDLGCGTGSMARWLAGHLGGPQHWVLHDRDEELLARAEQEAPKKAADGSAVTLEMRRGDVTRFGDTELAHADLVTASALLDMMTADELTRLVDTCARAGCPALITLSVVGRADLSPADPLDQQVMAAFNAHQQRPTAAGRLLGPDAARAAVHRFNSRGLDVKVRPSPWRLGPELGALTTAWFTGWLSAACEQRPELRDLTSAYARRRLSQAADGRLQVTVHHEDLLARWPPRADGHAGRAGRSDPIRHR